jgi:Cyclic nucleotide-binding domain
MENTSNTQHGERAEGWPALPMADDAVAFPTLDDSELAVLEALGSRRSVAVGEYLYREGDTTYDFYVILSGAAEIVIRTESEERIITCHGPGQFLGELNLLSGQRVYLSARVVEPGEVIVVPRVGAAPSDRDSADPQRHDPRRLSRPPVRAAERRIRCHPRRRFPVLARVAPGPGVLGPQPHPP